MLLYYFKKYLYVLSNRSRLIVCVQNNKIYAFENKEVILSTMNHDKYNNYVCFY